jgi:DNA replication protein DnaC
MLTTKLKRLRLGYAAGVLEAHHQQTLKDKLGYLEFLERLIDDELHSRDDKGMQKRLRAAHFPVVKTLEDFDFGFQPKLDAMLIKSLASCDFVAKHENVLLIGPPGVGKIILGPHLPSKPACAATACSLPPFSKHLASRLSAALADLSVDKVIKPLVDADLVILDELGFTPLGKTFADHIFRVVSERYERGSVIITSNKPFEAWGEMFADPILAAAVLDRLVHHAHIVPIIGNSYRTREQKTKAGTPAKIAKSAMTRVVPFSRPHPVPFSFSPTLARAPSQPADVA